MRHPDFHTKTPSYDLNIDFPPWAAPLLDQSIFSLARYIAVFGGRGSGKSHAIAGLIVLEHFLDANLKTVCIRETQKSLAYSSRQLLVDKIKSFKLEGYFEILESKIRRIGGSGEIIFVGMRDHTAENIKSLEGFDRALVEEAQNLSQRSLDILRPTIRKPGSKIFFIWNPRFQHDPVDNFFRGGDEPVPDSIVINVNFGDNPWFPDVLDSERRYDLSRDYEKYRHVWLGDYLTKSSSLVFKNWRIEEFDTDEEAEFRFGADWGYSIDPTVLVRCYLKGREIYIDYEAYMVGCEVTNTPALFLQVPKSERFPIIADSSNPQIISYMQRNGFPRMMAAAKGPGSVDEGIQFLQGYDLVVHPRCRHTIDELSTYSYRTFEDGTVVSVLEDKNNHVIDALRYAVEGVRRIRSAKRSLIARPPMPRVFLW